jgi:hypothetical protein
MLIKCDNCGFVHKVAGGYQRRQGTRPNTSDKIPSDGTYQWGQYQCDGCDKMVTVPEANEEK